MDPSWDIKQNYLEHLLNIQPLEVQFRSPNPLLGSMKDAECLVAGGCAILSLTNGICCGLSPNYERIVGKTPVLTILYYTISFYVVNSMHLKSHPFLLINSLGPIKLPTCQWNFPSCVLCVSFTVDSKWNILHGCSPLQKQQFDHRWLTKSPSLSPKNARFYRKIIQKDPKHSNFSQNPTKKIELLKQSYHSPNIRKHITHITPHPQHGPPHPHLPRITPPTTVCPSPLGVCAEVSPMTTSSRGEAAAAPESQGQTSWRLRLGKKKVGKKRIVIT